MRPVDESFQFSSEQQFQRVCIENPSLNFHRSPLYARSLVAEFREPSLDFLGICLRERLNTELNE
ncbi:hypothetical protein SAMN04488133_3391 [Halobellus limi]|uniref:Uncharacterized protein n=1 Tax=Halobellus limi TaxID=699433 RepID=A0A1H6CE48_9EURY|nr:hypothetical protein SAMN04488133_3391 [Halobellus limi]